MTDRITTSHEAPDVAELRRLLDECQPGRVIVNDLRPTHNAIWLDSRYDSGEWESLRTLAEIDTETETVEVLWGLNDAILIAAALNALPYLLERDALAADADRWQRAALTPQGDRDALLDRITHMTEARDNARAEVDRLGAAVEAVRKWATACATQATDYDEDTEQQIEDGREVLRILDGADQ